MAVFLVPEMVGLNPWSDLSPFSGDCGDALSGDRGAAAPLPPLMDTLTFDLFLAPGNAFVVAAALGSPDDYCSPEGFTEWPVVLPSCLFKMLP